MKTELITVPSFIYHQPDESDVQVNYYMNGIELVQSGNSIVIDYHELNTLFREIKKHTAEATKKLNNE